MKKAAEKQEMKVIQNLRGRTSILAEYNSIQSLIGTIQAKFPSSKNASTDSINSIKEEGSAIKCKEETAPVSNATEESPSKGSAEPRFSEEMKVIKPKLSIDMLNELNYESTKSAENISIQPSLSTNVSYNKR